MRVHKPHTAATGASPSAMVGNAHPTVENPRGLERGIARTIRGGSWRSLPAACRAAARQQNRETSSSDDLGFRVVRE